MKASFKQLRFNFFVYLAKKSRVTLKARETTHFSDHFADLTPKIDLLKSAKYLKTIKWALENSSVNNIALTGPYGSGKSSILNAFIVQNPQYKFLSISLAMFKESELKDDSHREIKDQKKEQRQEFKISSTLPENKRQPTRSEEDFHRLIEFSILQQMLYRKPARKFPLSRFKRIENPKRSIRTLLPVGILTWLFAALFVLLPRVRENFYSWKHMSFDVEIALNLFFGALFLAGSYIILRRLTSALSSAKLSKISLSGGEIELGKDIDASILNKYFDEILYFFDKTNYNVVVIEDLDRFNDPEIFTKLRELNLLLNQSEKLNRHIRFIYAIKDDMFLDKNRTKFFDFIIPVIPHISSTNSLDILKTKFSRAKLLDGIPTKFLYDIMLYVDDMRVLNNIVNEFIIYRENLSIKEMELEMSKLLAIVIYKNIYPNDFAELHCHQGNLFRIFSEKDNFISSILSQIKEDLASIQVELDESSKEQHSSLHELRSVYVLAAFELFPGTTRINQMLPDQLVQEANFEKMRKGQKIVHTNDTGTILGNRSTFVDIEKKVAHPKPFAEREAVISKKSEESLKTLTEQKNGKLRDQADAKKQPIKTLLRSYKGYHQKLFERCPLLGYLVREGYIDEMYEIYTSYFYKESLTINDIGFLRHLRNRVPLDFSYPLTNIEELMHRLDQDDMALEEILNYDISDYLLANQEKYSVFHSIYFKNIGRPSVRAKNFIIGYIQGHEENKDFLKSAMIGFPGVWDFLANTETFTEIEKEELLATLFEIGTTEELIALNVNDSLQTFLEQSPRALVLFNNSESRAKAKEIIDKLNIHFSSLEEENMGSPLIEHIYQTSRYKMSRKMILFFMHYSNPKNLEGGKLKALMEKAHFSTICEFGGQVLVEDTKKFIELYIRDIYMRLDGNKNESEKSLKFLLSSAREETEKDFIIENTLTIFNTLTDIAPELWPRLLEQRKIKATWENIITYRSTKLLLDQIAIDWLNDQENYMALATIVVPENYASEFKVDIILSDQISDQAFVKLIKGFNSILEKDVITALHADRADQLITNGNIELNVPNFKTLTGFGGYLHINLLTHHIKDFFKTPADFPLTPQDYIKILDEKINRHHKNRLIEMMDTTTIQEEARLAGIIIRIMLENKKIRRDFDFIETLLSHGQAFKQRAIQLFNATAKEYSSEEIKLLLKAMKGNFAKIAPGQYPSFEPNADVRTMFDILEEKKIAKLSPWGKKFRSLWIK